MKLSTFALQNAVIELLPGVSVDLPSLGHALTDVVDHEEMGDVLADLLFSGWPDASGGTLPLRRVQMTRPDGVLSLTPEDAFDHPAVRDWTFGTFGAALGRALWVGALRIDLEPGTPYIGTAVAVASLATMDGGRDYAAHFDFTLNGTTMVALEFGSAVAPAPFAEFRSISGQALLAVGFRARQVTEQLVRAAAATPQQQAA